MKKANFIDEYIVKEEMVKRPIVTVNRTGALFRGERDLIVCGNCGGVMSAKAKFCMGCGAKFQLVKDKKIYEDIIKALSGLDGQMSFEDLGGGSAHE